MMSDVKAATSVDMVASAHRRFLEAVFSRNFLKDASVGMLPKLRMLQNLVLALHPVIRNFLDAAAGENERRRRVASTVGKKKPAVPPKKAGLVNAKAAVANKNSRRTIGVASEKPIMSDNERISRVTFASSYIEPCRSKVRALRDDFMVRFKFNLLISCAYSLDYGFMDR
jgi:hypothetical protein